MNKKPKGRWFKTLQPTDYDLSQIPKHLHRTKATTQTTIEDTLDSNWLKAS